VSYETAFELMWSQMGARSPKGNKVLAQQRWVAQGRPDPVVVMAKWSEYVQSSGELSTMHIARWFGLRGWEDEYESAPARAAKPAVADPRCTWHRDPRNDARASSYPKPGCPRCKHFAARSGTRSGEPSEIGELAARKAAELEAESERKRLAAAERFRQERERDTKTSNGGTP
jgi:hypothetical protein